MCVHAVPWSSKENLWEEVLSIHFVGCGGLKEWPSKGVVTIRRCGLFEVGVALLEEVCHYGVCFEVSYMLKPLSVYWFASCCRHSKV